MVLITIYSWHSTSIRMAEPTEAVNCDCNEAGNLKKCNTESLMQAVFEPSRKPLRARTKGAVVERYGCMSPSPLEISVSIVNYHELSLYNLSANTLAYTSAARIHHIWSILLPFFAMHSMANGSPLGLEVHTCKAQERSYGLNGRVCRLPHVPLENP